MILGLILVIKTGINELELDSARVIKEKQGVYGKLTLLYLPCFVNLLLFNKFRHCIKT